MQTPLTGPPPQAAPEFIVREYTSTRAFDRDARELYDRTRYTISSTAGGPRRGLKGLLFLFWPREEHLTITYQSPTNPHPSTSN